jgi:hypothetical protein
LGGAGGEQPPASRSDIRAWAKFGIVRNSQPFPGPVFKFGDEGCGNG